MVRPISLSGSGVFNFSTLASTGFERIQGGGVTRRLFPAMA